MTTESQVCLPLMGEFRRLTSSRRLGRLPGDEHEFVVLEELACKARERERVLDHGLEASVARNAVQVCKVDEGQVRGIGAKAGLLGRDDHHSPAGAEKPEIGP